MATIRWNGLTSGDVGVGANYVGGAAPTAGVDSVLWDTITPYGMESGTMPALVDFTQTEGAGVARAGYTDGGNIGTSAGAPTFGNVTGTMTLNAEASLRKIATSGTIAAITAKMPTGAELVIGSGTFTRIDAWGRGGSGLVTIAASNTVTAFYPNGVRSVVSTSSNALATLEAMGGGVHEVTLRNITTGEVSGTSVLVTKGGTTGTGGSSGAVAAIDLIEGGTYNKQSAATDTLINVKYRGYFTPAGNPNASDSGATVTTANVYSGGRFVRAATGYIVKITNENLRGPDMAVASI